ncbi:MAG: chemotaxis protein CheX [Deltaproteobacteria bacterium]|nr:chemotaxis protein CheX [Deltaproteobacteria bacterium]
MGKMLDSDILSASVSQVLEDAAFIFTEEATEDLQWKDDILKSTIRYEGEESGTLCLAVNTLLAQNVAANLLGIEQEDEAAKSKAEEAVSEILNIVCGVFLESWLGKSNHCRMGIPSICAVSVNQEQEAFRSARCNAVLEDEEGNRIDVFVS